MENRFFIIVTGYNCAGNVERCYRSITSQTYRGPYDCVMINDGSTDDTQRAIERVCPWQSNIGGFIRDNRGAAFRRDYELRTGHEHKDEIVVFLGMDDELLPNALERINQEYENGKLMTYGNWQNQAGVVYPAELDFPDSVHADRSYRKVQYRSTAPNTFRRFLYDVIKPEDLQLNGEWYKATTESEVMFSCLEQCGKDRIGVIREPIYIYNQVVGGAARSRFGAAYQDKIYNHVIGKPKRELWSAL